MADLPPTDIVALPGDGLSGAFAMLGGAVNGVAQNAWDSAMGALWSGNMQLLTESFKLTDAFTTPDLSSTGPLHAFLPITAWISVSVLGLLMFTQLGAALIRRDGESLGRILLGTAQFGAVWIAYLAVAGTLVLAVGGLTRGILQAGLGASNFSAVALSKSLPQQLTDTATVTVLGLCSIALILPAAIAHVIIALARMAALYVLVSTATISAAGLVSDLGKAWFWKSARWFFAALLIPPVTALVLAIGVKMTEGALSTQTDQAAAHLGTVLVGAVLIAVAALCPMVLFRLLAFVDPGTSSGMAMRQSFADNGGTSGLLGGGERSGSTASQSDGAGRSAGEVGAESASTSRMSQAMGKAGALGGQAVALTQRAVDLGGDALGQAGVGDPGAYGQAPPKRRGGNSSGGNNSGGSSAGEPSPSEPPLPPVPPPPPPGPTPGPTPAGVGAGGGAGSAGGGISAGEAAAVVAL